MRHPATGRSRAHRVWGHVRGPISVVVVMALVCTGLLAVDSAPAAAGPNDIVMGGSGFVVVTGTKVNPNASYTHQVSVISPTAAVVCSPCTTSPQSASIGYRSAGTAVVVSMHVVETNATFMSDDPNEATVTQLSAWQWNVEFEDGGGSPIDVLVEIGSNADGLLGQRRSDRFAGDPVSVSTGNLFDNHVDLPSTAWGMTFARTYNSLNTAAGAFGPGWTTSLSTRMVNYTPLQTDVRLPDGRTITFTRPTSTDAWASPTEFRWTLTEDNGTWTIDTPDGGSMTFDSNGLMTEMTNGQLDSVALSYTAGLVSTATHYRDATATGDALTFADTNSDGRVDAITSADGRIVEFTYDLDGDLASVSDAHLVTETGYGVTEYDTDSSGHPETVRVRSNTDTPNTGRVTLATTYDTYGRVATQTSADGETTSFDYSTTANMTTVSSDAVSDSVIYEFDLFGDVIAITDGDGKTATFAYQNGKLTSNTDRLTATGETTFDGSGRVSSVTYADPETGLAGWASETYTYIGGTTGSDLRVESVTNPETEVTWMTYDGDEQLPSTVTVGYGTADAITTSYDIVDDRVMSTTDGDGVVTCYGYDTDTGATLEERVALDEVTGCADNPTDPTRWAITSYAYDNAGHLASRRDPDQQPSGPEWVWEYYGNGSTKRETKPDGSFVDYTYHPDGTLAATSDELANITTHTKAWDQAAVDCGAAGDGCSIETTVSPFDGVTTITTQDLYDRTGTLREHRDPGNSLGTWAATTYDYGLLGRLLSSTDPTGVVTSYAYDANGNLTRQAQGTDPNDATWRSETAYDLLGRVISTTEPADDNSHVTTSYDYDKLGRRTATIVAPGTALEQRTTTTYAPNGLVTETATARPDLGTSVEATVDTTYTPGGRVECVRSLLDTAGPTYSYTATDYAAAGRATRTRVATEPVNGCDDQANDPAVWATTATAYTPAGNVAWQQGPAQYVARPDPQASDHANYRTSFTYDPLGRTTATASPNPSFPGGATVTTTQCWTDRGELARSTDGAGNVTAYSYYDTPNLVRSVTDPRGMPVDPTNPCTATPVDGTTGTVSYGYDGRNNRTSRTGYDNSTPRQAITETWTYDLANRETSHTGGGADSTTSYDITAGRLRSTTRWTGSTSDPAAPSGSSRRSTTTTPWPSGRTGTQLDTTFDTNSNPADTYLSGTIYDPAGQITAVTGTYPTVGGPATDSIQFDHNQVGQVTGVTYPDAATAACTWDIGGRQRSAALPDGSAKRFTYDIRGLRTLSEFDTSTGYEPLSEVTYDIAGLPTSDTLVDGAGERTWTRDPASGLVDTYTEHLVDVTGTATTSEASWRLSWDQNGRLAADRRSNIILACDLNERLRSYTYDPAGQLLAVNTTNPADNEPQARTYTYGNRGERLESSTTTDPGTGPVTSTTANTYDPALRLTSAAVDAGTPTTYTSDAAGRRLDALQPLVDTQLHPITYDTRSRASDGTWTHFDPLGNPNQPGLWWDYSANTAYPTPIAGTWLGGRLDTGLAAIGITNQPDQTPTELFSVDPLGSVGGPTGAPEHGPYGEPTARPTPVGYRGELTADSGTLTYLRNRTLDTTTGTFLTPDPLDGVNATPTVANAYHYADNDPLNKADPAGLRSRDDDLQLTSLQCSSGTVPIESTPGNPSEHISSHGPQCVFPNVSCRIPGSGKLSSDFPRTLISVFYACQLLRPGAATLGESAGASEAFRAILGGAKPRLCGASARSIQVLCLSPVPRLASVAFVINGEGDAVTLGHFVLCRSDIACGSPNDPNSPNVLMHEFVHVDQWERYGDSFIGRYTRGVIIDTALGGRGPGCNNPIEREAYRIAPVAPDGTLTC